tara:strand:- start:474 stop:1577 length:1104 start_codon:yes stop_codon:yes gene_type:complete
MPLPAYMYDKDGDGTVTILDAQAMLADENENDLGWTADEGEGKAWLETQQTFLDTLDQNTNPFESTPPPQDKNSIEQLLMDEYGLSAEKAAEYAQYMTPYDPMQEAFRQEDLAFSMQDLAQDQRGSILEGLAAGEQSAFAGRGLQSGIAQRQTERAISESQKQYERGAAKERFGFQEDIFDMRDEWDITDEFEKLNTVGIIDPGEYQSLLKQTSVIEDGVSASDVGLDTEDTQALMAGQAENTLSPEAQEYYQPKREEFIEQTGYTQGGNVDFNKFPINKHFKESGGRYGTVQQGFGAGDFGYPQTQKVLEPNWESYPGEKIDFNSAIFTSNLGNNPGAKALKRQANYGRADFSWVGDESGGWSRTS